MCPASIHIVVFPIPLILTDRLSWNSMMPSTREAFLEEVFHVFLEEWHSPILEIVSYLTFHCINPGKIRAKLVYFSLHPVLVDLPIP
jgi:hypothetical protein